MEGCPGLAHLVRRARDSCLFLSKEEGRAHAEVSVVSSARSEADSKPRRGRNFACPRSPLFFFSFFPPRGSFIIFFSCLISHLVVIIDRSPLADLLILCCKSSVLFAHLRVSFRTLSPSPADTPSASPIPPHPLLISNGVLSPHATSPPILRSLFSSSVGLM